MVLNLRTPAGPGLAALRPLVPVLVAYVVSFTYVGIYWNNHHHLFQAADRLTGGVLWANLHLLFWLSLVPVVTAWVGANPAAPTPAAAYGVVLLMSGLAFTVLKAGLVRTGGPASPLARAAGGRDAKGALSLAGYAAAIGLAFVRPWLADAVFAAIAALWLVPDRRIERQLAGGPGTIADHDA